MWPSRQFLTHQVVHLSNPCLSNLETRMSWGAVSHLLLWSRQMISVALPLSTSVVTSSQKATRFVRRDLPLVKPRWLSPSTSSLPCHPSHPVVPQLYCCACRPTPGFPVQQNSRGPLPPSLTLDPVGNVLPSHAVAICHWGCMDPALPPFPLPPFSVRMSHILPYILVFATVFFPCSSMCFCEREGEEE